jgi:hypothetical protein
VEVSSLKAKDGNVATVAGGWPWVFKCTAVAANAFEDVE